MAEPAPADRDLSQPLLRTRTLASLAYDAIEQMILSGALAPGEHLNELALAERLGISRGPVREAVHGLERAGLVITVANQGSFVRTVSAGEAHELYDIRIVLTGYACAHLAAHATPAEVEVLRTHIRRMEAAEAAADAGRYYALNLEFHAALMQFCGNGRAQRIYEDIGRELNLFRRRSLVSAEGMRASNSEHAEMVRAIAAGDAEAARHAGEAHILRGRERFEATRPAGEAAALRAGSGIRRRRTHSEIER